MKTFTMICQFGVTHAFLVEHRLTPAELVTLDNLSGARFFSQPDLAKRWKVGFVFRSDDWAAEQRKRTPMLRPSGPRMAILEAKLC